MAAGYGRDHRTRDAGERAGNARLRAGPREEPHLPTPRLASPSRPEATPTSGWGAGYERSEVGCGAVGPSQPLASELVPRIVFFYRGLKRGSGSSPPPSCHPFFWDAHLWGASVQTQVSVPEIAFFWGATARFSSSCQKVLEVGDGKWEKGRPSLCSSAGRSEPQVPAVSQTLSQLQQWKWMNGPLPGLWKRPCWWTFLKSKGT